MSIIINAKNISVKYGLTEVIKDISFEIAKGDFVGLAGPNGAGKTTLVKALLGLLPISAGKVELFGQKKEEFNDWGKIGYLPQKFSSVNILFPATVEEVAGLGLLARKKLPRKITAEDKRRIAEILQELGISDLKNKMLAELSGGQQQKVFLARALISRPEILIFDEPSTALDPESRESFFKLLRKLNQDQGIAVILITHDTGYIGRYANKLLYIDKQVIYFGPFSDFCRSPRMNSYFGEYEQHIICHQHD